MHASMLGIICLGEIKVLIHTHFPTTVGTDVTYVTVTFGHMSTANASVHIVP
jgi:hypothetical protein